MSQIRGFRNKATTLKTAKGRKISSSKWLQRHLNDPYVAKAKLEGYRSRAAYKLLEIQEKFSLIKRGMNIVDLGAAPGGWSQIAANISCASDIDAKNKLIAVDILEIDPIPGVVTLKQDFYDINAKDAIIKALDGNLADVVLSDMAANTTGHKSTDHIRIIDLCINALEFAKKILKPNGHFIAKIFQGGVTSELTLALRQHFKVIKHFKPSSSRADSAETYIVAMQFKL